MPKVTTPVYDTVGRPIQPGDHVIYAKGGPGTVFGADLNFGQVVSINPKANNGRGNVTMYVAMPRFDQATSALTFRRERTNIRADSVFIIPAGLIPPDGLDAISLMRQEWESR